MHAHAGDASARCRACHAEVVPLREGRHWKVLVVVGYAGICLLGAVSAAAGPYTVFLLPFTVMGGLGIVGPIHARASAEPICPNCERIFEADASGCAHQPAGRMVPGRHGQQEEAPPA